MGGARLYKKRRIPAAPWDPRHRVFLLGPDSFTAGFFHELPSYLPYETAQQLVDTQALSYTVLFAVYDVMDEKHWN